MFIYNKIKPCQKYCLPIGGLILLFLIFCLITLPSIKKINFLNQQILEERKKLEEFYQKSQNIKDSKKEYEKIRNQTTLLDKVFIEKDNEIEFITQLEKKSEEYEIIQNISIDTNNLKKENMVFKMPIEIRLQGDYFNILKYLQDIEATDFYLNIESISADKEKILKFSQNINEPEKLPNKNEANPLVTFNLKGFVYYYEN